MTQPPWPPAPPPVAPGSHAAPGPPRGPGVQVPFGAPPTERDRKRMWIGLGIGGAVLLLCCVGGIFGFGALVVENARAVQAEATSVVNDYLGALHDRDYRRAYDDLCDQLQAQTSYESFVNSETGQTPISSYTVEAPRVQGSNVLVYATVTRQDGSTQTPEYKLAQTGQAVAALKICGIAQ